MSDESESVTAVAKGIEESAKTGRALVEAGSDLAKFVGKALGTIPEDTVGLLGGDYLHELRLRNLDKISRKTEKILHERGIEEPEPIGPKALLPALEAASAETNETLQDMWALLLANAMDPERNVPPRRIFIDTLKEFEPLDALAFLHMGKLMASEKAKRKDYKFDRTGLSKALDVRPTEADLSIQNLVKLGCLTPPNPPGATSSGPPMRLTSLGIELYLACNPDAEA